MQAAPALPEAYELLGRAAASLRLYTVASRAYGLAIAKEAELSPIVRSCTARALVGLAHMDLGRERWSAAVDRLSEALRLRPRDPSVLAPLSRACLALGRGEDGARFLFGALDAWEAPPDVWIILADAYERQGRLQEALATLREAAAQLPAEPLYPMMLSRLARRA